MPTIPHRAGSVINTVYDDTTDLTTALSGAPPSSISSSSPTYTVTASGAAPAANKSGWTGSLIAPNMRVHDAASAAIDHVGNKDMMQATVDPAHPEHQVVLTNQVLRDPTLGSRSTITGNAPAANQPVGSASVSQYPGGGPVPAAIQQAMSNLNFNTQNSDLMQILNKVLGLGVMGSGGAGSAISPQQNAYYQSQADLNKYKLATAQAPAQIQSQIDALSKTTAPLTGIMNLNPSLPGDYNSNVNPSLYNQSNANAQLQNLYGQLNTAKQAASGWTAPTY